jgi:CubicO group peptidase (beta-lactamase class C family)
MKTSVLKALTVALAAMLAIAAINAFAVMESSNVSIVKRLDGSTISSQEIDATVTRLMHAAKIPGAGIAILNDQKVVYLKAYGYRDKEKALPLTENSVMTAASLT